MRELAAVLVAPNVATVCKLCGVIYVSPSKHAITCRGCSNAMVNVGLSYRQRAAIVLEAMTK